MTPDQIINDIDDAICQFTQTRLLRPELIYLRSDIYRKMLADGERYLHGNSLQGMELMGLPVFEVHDPRHPNIKVA